MYPLLWSTRTPDGYLQWMPEDLSNRPAWCPIDTAPLHTSAANQAGDPIELTCDAGHKWLSVLEEIERRIQNR